MFCDKTVGNAFRFSFINHFEGFKVHRLVVASLVFRLLMRK